MTRQDIAAPVTLPPPFKVGDLVGDPASGQVTRIASLWQPETGGPLRAYLDYPCGQGGRFVPVASLVPLSGSLGGAG